MKLGHQHLPAWQLVEPIADRISPSTLEHFDVGSNSEMTQLCRISERVSTLGSGFQLESCGR